ncbi:hypothetical protein VD0004_g441 [Verticillium dahliae]|uniref:DUF1479 domain-containing protein n=1 Tax=Verticillium dahliae TaxID=27337 RepID=A0AA44WCP1_VERDA|nr:hypothetical protein BJF96_g8090 [Verticillium dahliae]PNH47935.1 hypothetical protein VD0004_g441 [Verticillium dahliae]PNH49818.1 hypothetical protein VD0003_g7337 [Verticillium dahliae]PNH77066.1 hypothetical protein VD0001_g473 [Verticillium dahliae]
MILARWAAGPTAAPPDPPPGEGEGGTSQGQIPEQGPGQGPGQVPGQVPGHGAAPGAVPGAVPGAGDGATTKVAKSSPGKRTRTGKTSRKSKMNKKTASSTPPMSSAPASATASAPASAGASRATSLSPTFPSPVAVTRPSTRTTSRTSSSSSAPTTRSTRTSTATNTNAHATPTTSPPTTSAAAIHRRAFRNMEPPVVSFYGNEPIPLPSRFAGVKRRLITGHEAAVEASWRRLLVALAREIDEIQRRGAELIPTIHFNDINDPVRVDAFAHRLKRYGVAVIRGVVPEDEAKEWVQETREYLDTNREFKPPALHDPTCIDLFWTPVQVRARAHPNTLRAQRFAMSFWESTDDLHITRCPVSYADRLRIHNDKLGAVGQQNGNSAADSLSASASSTVIAQVDSGSLERWEPDGYGRGGTYEAVFRGDWESYDPWDPAGRVGATTDLYNGAGACSVFRMFQGVLALTDIEQGMVRVLPSPKLVAAYFLLRPFFSPRRPPPEQPDGGKADQWAAYLDADNWALDPEPSTIIHGAVPGHAQRITERWHPHLHMRRSLVSLPALQPGDYVIWHCDEAYSIISGGTRLGVPPSMQTESNELSLLTYMPVCPLTQTNALFLARQRKAFQTGQPGPDFDTLSGLGSEASHIQRPDAATIERYGGVEGLRAMGLAPWDIEPAGAPPRSVPASDAMDVDGGEPPPASAPAEQDDDENDATRSASSHSEAEAELLRLANIILFPSRYDFYIPGGSGRSGSGDRTPRTGLVSAPVLNNGITSGAVPASAPAASSAPSVPKTKAPPPKTTVNGPKTAVNGPKTAVHGAGPTATAGPT